MPGRNGTSGADAPGSAKLNGKVRIDSVSVGTGAGRRAEAGEGQHDALVDKQKELEGIVDRHDDLVREMFQMEKFLNMLLYDPKTAKEDKTAVFQEYKAKYDLVDKTAPVAGPSRQTRGRIQERRQIISAPIVPDKRKTVVRNIDGLKEIIATAKGKGKAKADVPTSDIPKVQKGKGKVPDTPFGDTVTFITKSTPESAPSTEFASTPAGKGNAKAQEVNFQPDAVPKNGRKGKAKQAGSGQESSVGGSLRLIRKPPAGITNDALDPSTPKGDGKANVDAQLDGTPITRKKRKTSNAAVEETISAARPQTARIIRQSKLGDPALTSVRRQVIPAKRSAQVPLDVLERVEKGTVSCPPQPPPESFSAAPRTNGRTREPLSVYPPPDPAVKPTVALKFGPPKAVLSVAKDIPPPLPSPPKIKRIRLIVRRPPPPLTNPKQRPPPPKYNESLIQFLTSYISLDEEQDADLDNLQQQIRDEANIREQVVQFREQGRFIPGTDVLFGSQPHEHVYTGPAPRTTRDIWDDIVQAVVARGRAQKAKQPLGKRIAAQVAARVQAHFGGQEARKQKAVENEEKRLRVLAKTTLKAVTVEWKKAVYHIREKQRLAEEAEERRLGHIHLDAILNQSGAILETQHGDLARVNGSRSRSGSIAEFYGSERGDEDADQSEREREDSDDGDEDGEIGDDVGDTTSIGVRSVYDEDEAMEDVEADHGADHGHELEGGDVVEDEDEDDSDGGDADAGTTSLLKDGPTLSSAPSLHDSRATPSAASETGPLTLENEDVARSPRLSSPPLTNALNALRMYDDSDSDTDLADIIALNLDDSPQKSRESEAGLRRASPSSNATSPPNGPMIEPVYTAREDAIAGTSVVEHMLVDEREAKEDVQPPPNGDLEMDIAQDEDITEIARVSLGDGDLDMDKDTQEVDEAAEEAEVEGEDEDEESDAEVQNGAEDESEGGGGGEEDDADVEAQIPEYLQPYAVAPVEWNPESKVIPPLLLRGVLRPYQQSGLEWLASLHTNKLNGILADEMGLGKTIQTISLLAHLACDHGIWGPHLIVVPTSVLLNWEMEFKKFLPGFKVLSYHGSQKRRKELRQGWNDKYQFNVCITSYTLASKDAHIFKRKAWYYMILDEAHMIKNFKSQRWNILLMFRSYRRLLLTGTPLQNNLTELWALLQFLMSGANFANLKEFGEWFSNPLEKAIEMGNALDDETMQRVSKLHTVLRPYLLRRLKRDVEKELPSKFEHLTLCPLSKRQRFLYDEFMSRAQTRDALESGIYQKIANILMQLRKVCNHPDLFEVRPIVTSFAMPQSAVASFEIKELLIRRRFLEEQDDTVNLDIIGLLFIDRQNVPLLSAVETRQLDSTKTLSYFTKTAGEPPPNDTRTMAGFRKYTAYMRRADAVARWAHVGYLNKLRCSHIPIFSSECISVVEQMTTRIKPFSDIESRHNYLDTPDTVNKSVKSYATRALEMAPLVDHFAFITPAVVAPDLPRFALAGNTDVVEQLPIEFDAILHRAAVKKQIAFPDPSLLQYDCGKLQKLASLLREKKAGGHRVLIFTQMTRILDILEIFLNFNGHLYLRLDGATKIEDRQYITERFNADPRIFCFIASSRSGGVGINLTGADTVIFYDSDFNPQMDRQCEDRAHRIGQIRDVHIYRFVSQFTVEEAMLLKANQKRSLDDIVIQKGEFDWRSLFNDENALTKALGDFEDAEDQHAAAVAAREEFSLVGADEADFSELETLSAAGQATLSQPIVSVDVDDQDQFEGSDIEAAEDDDDDDDQGGSIADYMLAFVEREYDDFFENWRL